MILKSEQKRNKYFLNFLGRVVIYGFYSFSNIEVRPRYGKDVPFAVFQGYRPVSGVDLHVTGMNDQITEIMSSTRPSTAVSRLDRMMQENGLLVEEMDHRLGYFVIGDTARPSTGRDIAGRQASMRRAG